jgi:hypothetical protein
MNAPPLCECGCGKPAPIIKANNTARGYVAGEYHRFIVGHQNRGRIPTADARTARSRRLIGHVVSDETRRKISENHRSKGIRPSAEATAKGNAHRGRRSESHSWKGGVSETNGYPCIYLPEHPRAMPNGYVYEHIIVAEKKLGRPILPEEAIHHDDEVKTNNDPDNLIVFPSNSAHVAHHAARRRATRP